MKKFLNEEMSAPNVLRVPLEIDPAEELGVLAKSGSERRRLYSVAPPWQSDIRWYSARNEGDFARFKSLFERLGVAERVRDYVDLDQQVRLYNSFLVVRSHCDAANFHVDWADTNNEGFTLMTPLSDNCSGFGMLYHKTDGSIGEYEYKRGEALIFGDDFMHSTKPGHSDEPVVLLCFNFGTDKMMHWPRIERTAARQGLLICRPDGRFQRVSLARRFRKAVGRFLRRVGLRRPLAAAAGY